MPNTAVLIILVALAILGIAVVWMLYILKGMLARLARLRADINEKEQRIAALADRSAIAQKKANAAETAVTVYRDEIDALQTGLTGTKDHLARVADKQEAQRAEATRVADEQDAKLGRLNGKLDELSHYLKDVFQQDLRGAMDAFDRTVSGVLGEMKTELLNGVNRIESIEHAVHGRGQVGDKLVAGSEKAGGLLEEAKAEAGAEEPADDRQFEETLAVEGMPPHVDEAPGSAGVATVVSTSDPDALDDDADPEDATGPVVFGPEGSDESP